MTLEQIIEYGTVIIMITGLITWFNNQMKRIKGDAKDIARQEIMAQKLQCNEQISSIKEELNGNISKVKEDTATINGKLDTITDLIKDGN